MARPTPAEFRTEYAEFRLISDDVINAKLDAAYLRTGDSWGDFRDTGAKLLTAHLIALSPLGEPSSKSVKTGTRTTYLDEYERMLSEVRIFGTTGDAPTALPPGD